MAWKKYGEDKIVVQNFIRKSVEKMLLGRTSTWNCKEEIIQIKEVRTNYMNGTGIMCMKIAAISSNTVRVVVALFTVPNGYFMERIHAVILGVFY